MVITYCFLCQGPAEMVILGINAYHADAAAAIVIDGRLIAAAEEARLGRVREGEKAGKLGGEEAGRRGKGEEQIVTGGNGLSWMG